MKIIRGRLNADQVTPANTRWNVDCNCVQTSPDNGTTWNDNDGADPRKNPAGLLPALSGGDAQCDAAERMTAAMHRYVDTVINAASVLEAINGVLAIILVFLPGVGTIIEAIGAGITALFGIGTAAINLAMTDDVYEQIKCILYCHIDAIGQVSADALDAINADMNSQLAFIPAQVWNVYINGLGRVGLANSGVAGTETGDCTGCACDHCFEIDLTLSDGSDFGVHIQGGSWSDGVGLIGGNFPPFSFSDAYGYWAFGETVLVKVISITYTKTDNGGGVNHFNALIPATSYASTTVASNNTDTLGTALEKSIEYDGNLDGMGWDVNSGTATVTVVVSKLKVTYTGDIPSGWSDNC